MKHYIKPENQIIDLYEETAILNLSNNKKESLDINSQEYADKALGNKQDIWKYMRE